MSHHKKSKSRKKRDHRESNNASRERENHDFVDSVLTQYEELKEDKKDGPLQNKDIFGTVSDQVYNLAEKEFRSDPAFDYNSTARTPGFGNTYFK